MKETNKARSAFEDYYLMGPRRSIEKLLVQYHTYPEASPTRHIATLKKWSAKHGWQERVRQRDQEIADAVMNKIIATATDTGYAVFQKRIHDLGVLAERMFGLLDHGLLDPKVVHEFRGLLSDIAAETGGREKKHSVIVGWRDDIIELLKNGRLEPQDVIDDLGEDLATELFITAGVFGSESGESETPGATSAVA